MNNDNDIAKDEQESSTVMDKNFKGSVTRVFKGDNTLEYGFNLVETATATVSMGGALVQVRDQGAPVLAMYVSFEGERGYGPDEYIAKNIIPKVSTATVVGTTTIGEYQWTVVQSNNSEWHVTKVANGSWLLVVENIKVNTEKATTIIESISTTVPAEEMSSKAMDSTMTTDVEVSAPEAQ